MTLSAVEGETPFNSPECHYICSQRYCFIKNSGPFLLTCNVMEIFKFEIRRSRRVHAESDPLAFATRLNFACDRCKINWYWYGLSKTNKHFYLKNVWFVWLSVRLTIDVVSLIHTSHLIVFLNVESFKKTIKWLVPVPNFIKNNFFLFIGSVKKIQCDLNST